MMKVVMYLFMCVSFIKISYAQESKVNAFINQDNIVIPLYFDSLKNEVKYTIYQDSIFEHFYGIAILEEYFSRFKVNLFSVSQYNSPDIYGWIDKKYCSVFIKTSNEMKLYDRPSKLSRYVKLVITDDIMSNVLNLDTRDSKFIRVSFWIDKRHYEGWIDTYCSSIYNTCN